MLETGPEPITVPTREEGSPPAEQPFVVGVGASAGGLEALQRFFDVIRPTGRAAFVVVQHLSPDFKSLMDELLSRHTSLAIHKAESGMLVEPDALYLLPPRKEMVISGGRLVLRDREPEQGLSLPIDTFFTSLARDAAQRAVAIVLSGTGSDGSRGIRAVHEAGGLVLAQTEESAKFDGMPRSAIETGVVDAALPPEELARALLRYISSGGALTLDPDGAGERDVMTRILELLRSETGVDFSGYKPTTVGRRVRRRLLMSDSRDLDQYLDRMAADPAELRSLYKDLLIGVTRFFRDPEAFEAVRREVLPAALDRLGPGEELRVWVPGCATGEEAYSIAILVHEAFRARGQAPALKLFATDIHRASLDVASTGSYSAEAVTGVPPELRERYFARVGDEFHVAQDIRGSIVFAHHNLLRDAPFTKLDLVSCRNLLIYLNTGPQQKIMALFHFALRTNGVLLLGPSESPGPLAEEFAVVDARWKLFRKRRDVRLRPEVPLVPAMGDPSRRVVRPRGAEEDARVRAAREGLLQRYAPPALLVDEALNLVHAFNGAARFLAHRDGAPSLNLADLLEGELRFVVVGAIRHVLKERHPLEHANVATGPAPTERVRVRVSPVTDGRTDEGVLVTLEPEAAPAQELTPRSDVSELAQERVSGLENELRYTKENLQATVEEMESSNEELQSTNEELIASNEELQSTNEELHSVNEELYTVNAEYQAKIVELTELTADMNHLLESTQVHTLFLDRELRLRKFTPRIAELFNLLPHDIGRRIEGFAHELDDPHLGADLASVLESGEPVEREVHDRAGRAYLLRILPYRPADVVDGVVLTLIDISALRQAQRSVHEKTAQLRGILDYSPAFIWVKDLEGRYLVTSRSAEHVLGTAADHAIGKTDRDLATSALADARAAADRKAAVSGAVNEVEEDLPWAGGRRTFVTTRFALRDASGGVVGVAGISTDMSDRLRAAEQDREAIERRDRLLAMLSHELRTPLGAILNAVDLAAARAADAERRDGALEIIRRQSRHMARLLDDLLDVARITRDQLVIQKRAVDLAQVTRDAADAMSPGIAKKQLLLSLQLPAEPVRVLGDPNRLQQIVSNLLANAMKYTHRGSIAVSVEVLDGYALLRVKDTGIGMTADELGKAFDLFYQAPQASDRSLGGLGVGLNLAQRLAHLHGGTISATSGGREMGCEFVLELPLLAGDEEPSRAADTPPAPALRIVLVEDNDDIRDTLEELLQLGGHEVLSARDGVSGAALIEEHRPDVALVDLGLPGIDGLELARRVRGSVGDAVRLVALTGYGGSEDKARTRSAGFDFHVLKPVDVQQLLELCARVARDRPRRPAPGIDVAT